MFEEDCQQRDVFLLKPIDEETFQLAKEYWVIWCRWERAFQEKRVSLETHPALPEDRARHEVLKLLLEPRLAVRGQGAVRRIGEFQVLQPEECDATLGTPWIVRWLEKDEPLEA
jgi:hypothetical protein